MTEKNLEKDFDALAKSIHDLAKALAARSKQIGSQDRGLSPNDTLALASELRGFSEEMQRCVASAQKPAGEVPPSG